MNRPLMMILSALLFCSTAYSADIIEISPLVAEADKLGIKSFSCNVVGQQMVDPTTGIYGLGDTRSLEPRLILAFNKLEALKLCLTKVNAKKGYVAGPTKGKTSLVFMITDLPELKGRGMPLFIVDKIEINEVRF